MSNRGLLLLALLQGPLLLLLPHPGLSVGPGRLRTPSTPRHKPRPPWGRPPSRPWRPQWGHLLQQLINLRAAPRARGRAFEWVSRCEGGASLMVCLRAARPPRNERRDEHPPFRLGVA